jgi:hypothetical protein
MQTTHRSKKAEPAQPVEKLYLENTRLRMSGALFLPRSPNGRRHAPQKIEFNMATTNKHMVIRPDLEYGQPEQLAHKVFVALIKKHSDYGRPIQKAGLLHQALGHAHGRPTGLGKPGRREITFPTYRTLTFTDLNNDVSVG